MHGQYNVKFNYTFQPNFNITNRNIFFFQIETLNNSFNYILIILLY
jgi:hypothetical protein